MHQLFKHNAKSCAHMLKCLHVCLCFFISLSDASWWLKVNHASLSDEYVCVCVLWHVHLHSFAQRSSNEQSGESGCVMR